MVWFWQDLPLHKLPGVFSVDIKAPTEPGEPVRVHILLKGYRRADVAKWAAHLGSEVVEGDLHRDVLGRWERPVETVQETKGFRVAVRTTVPIKGDPDLSGLPWRVYAQPAEGERRLVNAFSTRGRAERFVEQHPTRYGPLTIECAEESAAAGRDGGA